MASTALLQEIDSIIASIKNIPATRNYWLIRTQSGEYYESFRTHNFVAIEHEKISLADIGSVRWKYLSFLISIQLIKFAFFRYS